MDPEIVLMAAAALVLVVSQVVRWRRAEALHRSLQEAIRTGSPELVERLCGLVDRERTGSPIGAVLIALALAIVGFAFLDGNPSNLPRLAGAALFPALVGIALLVSQRLSGGRDR